MRKLNYKKMLASALSFTVIATGGFQAAYAVTGSEVAADKSYQGHAKVADQDDFDGYDIDVSFDVVDGNFSNIMVTSSNMHKSNKTYKAIADDKIKTLEGKAATMENLNAVDATSGATFTVNSIKSAMSEQLEKADVAKPKTPDTPSEPTPPGTTDNEMVYGKVNLPFADFYYGELNNLTMVNSTMDLTTMDKTKALKETGMYDTVSSATPSKYKSLFPTTYSMDNEGGNGGKILGVKDVDVAISKTLYDEAQKAIRDGRTSNNPLLDIVKNMTVNTPDMPAPTEYKQINGDGTLTKTMEPSAAIILEGVDASISTTNRYGHYGLYINSDSLPSVEDINGVVVTTDDGKQYAMKHLENIWRNPREISFAAKDGFVEPHGNKVNYMAYSDIQKKTIKEVKYLVKNKPDLVVKTNLFCKALLEDDQKATIPNAVFENGVSVMTTIVAPEGSNYTLASLTKGRTKLAAGTDYTVDGNKITFMSTNNTGIGGYTAKFEDNMFADMVANFALTSHHEDGSVKIENNKLVLPEDIDKDAYYASVTRVLVDGQALRGRDIPKTIFGDNLTADFNAALVRHGNKIPIFTKGDSAEYDIELVSVGYPSVKGKLVNGPVKPELTEKTLTEGDVSVTAKMSADAKLVVTKLDDAATPATIKDLVAGMENKKIFDSYDVSIQGEYEGPISITLPTSLVAEKALIAHLPTVGDLEQFEAPVAEGKTMFKVNSLSPFAVIGDKPADANNDADATGDNDQNAPGNNNQNNMNGADANNDANNAAMGSDNAGMDNDKMTSAKKDTKMKSNKHTVKTDDTRNMVILFTAMLASALSVLAYSLRLRKNK